MPIIERLQRKNDFTTVESILADYILENLNSICDMTLQELSAAAYVSKPTIIRFYKKLGFKSYRDFSLKLQIESNDADKKLSIDPNFPYDASDSDLTIAEKLGKLSKQVIDGCLASVDQFTLSNIVNTLYKAKRIFIFAIGNNYVVSQLFTNRMGRLNRYPIQLNANQYPYTNIYNLESDDVVLIISSTGKTMKIERKSINLILASDAKKILITSETSIPYKHFNYVYRIYNGENATEKHNTSASQISVLFTLNLIFDCLFKRCYEENSQRSRKLSEFVSKVQP